MASPEDDAGEHLSDGPGRLARWGAATARWLPPVLCAVVVVGALAFVADDGPPPANAGTVSADRPTTPVLSLRRWPGPIARAAADQRLQDRLAGFVADQPEDTCLSVAVEGVRFDHRPDDPQRPASIQKLLTAVAVLTELARDTTFVTEVRAPSPNGDGVVTGDLGLVGGGDPLLATEPYAARGRQPQAVTRFETLADEIVAAGVTAVLGRVVGSEGRYDDDRYSDAWPDRLVVQGVTGPLSALSLNDGFAYFPDGGAVFSAAEDPPAYAATVLQQLLEERGVAFLGDAGSGPASEAPVLASIESPPLVDVVGQMLAESDNTTAELLVKELGRQRRGEGSFAAGREAVAEILAEQGLDDETLVVADGSGLAPGDQLSCDLVVEVLQHGPTAEDVMAGLAVSGETGTLSRRWLGTDLVGEVRAKTGTLDHVTGLAGVAATGTDEDARFALVVNLPDDVFVSAELIAAQQELAEILTAYPEIPDLADVTP